MDIKWKPLKPREPVLTITVDPKVSEELAAGEPETVVNLQDASGRILGYFTGSFIPAGSVEVATLTAEQLEALHLGDKSLELESGGRSLREIMNELERKTHQANDSATAQDVATP